MVQLQRRPGTFEERIQRDKEIKKWLLENEDKWYLFDRDYLASYGIDAPEE